MNAFSHPDPPEAKLLPRTHRMMNMMCFWRILIPGGCVFIWLPSSSFEQPSLFSAAPPKVDETDIGNRDEALQHTYKGLPKLRYVMGC